MEDHRLLKIALYGELSTSHRDRGAPKKGYKDCLKKSLGVDRTSQIVKPGVTPSISPVLNSPRATLKEKEP